MAVIEKRTFVVTCDICKRTEEVIKDVHYYIDSSCQVRPLMAGAIIPVFWGVLQYRGDGAKTLCGVCVEKEWKSNRAALERKTV